MLVYDAEGVTTNDEEFMLELLSEVILNGYGKAIDGMIRSKMFAEVIRNFNEKMRTSISKKHEENQTET